MADINKAGLLVVRAGRILLCRKKHTTSLLILPGGKLEPGELPQDCVRRELREELGVEAELIEFIGTYADEAAGATGRTVQVDLYRGELAGDPAPQSEIGELVWFAASDDRAQLAPSIRNKILPDLIARGIIAAPQQPEDRSLGATLPDS